MELRSNEAERLVTEAPEAAPGPSTMVVLGAVVSRVNERILLAELSRVEVTPIAIRLGTCTRIAPSAVGTTVKLYEAPEPENEPV